MEKRSWFYLDSFCHVSVKSHDILLYNPYTGKILEYSNEPGILHLVTRLLNPQNLRVVELSEADLSCSSTTSFVHDVREHFMGDLLDMSYSETKPVQMPPVVKIQKDIDGQLHDDIMTTGEEIMNYLTSLSLYINDNCTLDCDICGKAYRQFPCCTAYSNNHLEIELKLIDRFFQEIQYCTLNNVDILGGDIFDYSRFDFLIKKILALDTGIINLFQHYANIDRRSYFLENLTDRRIRLKVLVPFPVDSKRLVSVVEAVDKAKLKVIYVFIIRNEEDYRCSQSLIPDSSDSMFEFQVFHDGTNLDFFKRYVFIDRENIERERPSLKDIYIREKINPLNFGHLVIMPDMHFYANVNAPSLGTPGKESIRDILMKELTQGKSWLKTRKKLMPCKRCTFENLCPPISNYTDAFGRYDLCRIKEQRE